MNAETVSTRTRPAPLTTLLRGIGPWAGLAMTLLLTAHLAFRPWDWANEWRLVAWQYAFALVMVGPMAAGFSAWEATQVRKRGVAVLAAGRSTPALSFVVWSIACWTIIPFAIGALFIFTYTFVAGAPGGPALGDLAPLILGVLSIVFFCSLGTVAGWRFPHMLTSPLLASILFGCTVVLYGTDLSFIVDLGGSSASLLGLIPNKNRQILQAAFFIVGAAAALYGAGGDPYRSRLGAILAKVLIAATLALIIFGAAKSPERLVPTMTDEMVCMSSARDVRVCLGPGYSDRLPGIVSALDAPLSKLEDAGIDAPKEFDQRSGILGASHVDVNLLTQGSTVPAQSVAAFFVPEDCDLFATPGPLDNLGALSWWLSPEDSDRGQLWPEETLPHQLRNGDVSSQHEEIQRIVQDLSTCSGG